MTRWTRHKNTKSVNDGSRWEELKPECTSSEQDNRSKKHKNNDKGKYERHLQEVRRTIVKKDKRSENRRLKRQRRKQNNTVCFHCRMPGHGMADCPVLSQDNEQGTGICFKCGSTEHKSHTCTAKVEAGKEFTFAKCFICGEEGHLSRSCPDNPRGLYPNGGCCNLCGSVDHFRKDCPERKIKDEVTLYRIPSTLGSSHISADDEISLYQDEIIKPPSIPAKKKRKIVKF